MEDDITIIVTFLFTRTDIAAFTKLENRVFKKLHRKLLRVKKVELILGTILPSLRRLGMWVIM